MNLSDITSLQKTEVLFFRKYLNRVDTGYRSA